MHRRLFLASLASSTAAVGAFELAWAAPFLEASATRTAPDRVRLQWTDKSARMQIFASTDPDAPQVLMRSLGAGARGEYEAVTSVSPRPYFLITGAGGQARVAERLLPLQGGRNFRDLGGYRAADGRQVKWGKLYRAGVMSGLTAGDLDYFGGLGIRAVCDLRTESERSQEPAPFKGVDGPVISAFKYDLGPSMAPIFQARTRKEAVQAFAAAYLQMAEALAPNYTDMFQRLLRREAPLAVNCSAGKDRTGLAAAFLLSVLGVPRETVIADYALSETFVPPEYYRAEMRKAAESGTGASGASLREAQAFAQMPTEVADIILGSDPQVLRLTLAKLDAEHGGPVGYAKSKFQIDDAAIARLQKLYLVA